MGRYISLMLFIGLGLGYNHFNTFWILGDNEILKISPRKTIDQILKKDWYFKIKNKYLRTKSVQLSHGIDVSAGGDSVYIIRTSSATFYLEKTGGGLSSMLDIDGVDWLGFRKEEGSGWKGEYRGFPNSIHRQDGNYFHAMNSNTDSSTSVVEIESDDHVRIVFTSGNGRWEGRWDFYIGRCDFTMSKVSDGYKYWVLYEGVPNGEINETDYWFGSIDDQIREIHEPFSGDLPAPEWIAFGDTRSPRMLYLLQHNDDDNLDEYYLRPYMTVFGFGRNDGNKYFTDPNTFSIGFVESTDYKQVQKAVTAIHK